MRIWICIRWGVMPGFYKEDVFSIVDTFFMPYGMECDQYQILGNIEYCQKVQNTVTDEYVYQMTLECNDMYFDICVNAKDLLGCAGNRPSLQGQHLAAGSTEF